MHTVNLTCILKAVCLNIHACTSLVQHVLELHSLGVRALSRPSVAAANEGVLSHDACVHCSDACTSKTVRVTTLACCRCLQRLLVSSQSRARRPASSCTSPCKVRRSAPVHGNRWTGGHILLSWMSAQGHNLYLPPTGAPSGALYLLAIAATAPDTCGALSPASTLAATWQLYHGSGCRCVSFCLSASPCSCDAALGLDGMHAAMVINCMHAGLDDLHVKGIMTKHAQICR